MYEEKTQIQDLTLRLEKLKEALDLAKKRKDIEILEAESAEPGLWNDQEKARKLMQKLADAKKEIQEFDDLTQDLKTLKELVEEEAITDDFQKEIAKSQKLLEKLELSTLLSGQYDKKNAIVSIHAGQGGTEAMDWVSTLLRMYLRFCERRGWKTSVLDSTSGEEAGIKSITFRLEGAYSYGYLKSEAGTHRLVRQSPFNADKLRQTSFALVEVLPELEELDLPDIKIKDEDLEWQFFRSSSQGGQNVQKVSTAVRVIHKPTGIVVSAQSERFQEQNRKNALNLLRSKLWMLEREKAKNTEKGLKGDYKPASWGNQIRSYVLHPYKMVKDLRTEVETSNTEAVLDGDLDMFIEAELKVQQ